MPNGSIMKRNKTERRGGFVLLSLACGSMAGILRGLGRERVKRLQSICVQICHGAIPRQGSKAFPATPRDGEQEAPELGFSAGSNSRSSPGQ